MKTIWVSFEERGAAAAFVSSELREVRVFRLQLSKAAESFRNRAPNAVNHNFARINCFESRSQEPGMAEMEKIKEIDKSERETAMRKKIS